MRVFAFRERPIPSTPYRVIAPNDIVEISDVAQREVFPGIQARAGDFTAERIRVYGKGRTDVGNLDRVLVVTDNLARRYVQLYGQRYRDFAKYLVYFVYAQEDFASDLSACRPVMHRLRVNA